MDSEKFQEVNAEWARDQWLEEKFGDEDKDNYCVYCAIPEVGRVCYNCNEYKGVMSKEEAIKSGYQFCPDCDSMITSFNTLVPEQYNPSEFGSCDGCYDPTPAGPEYSPGFEMNH